MDVEKENQEFDQNSKRRLNYSKVHGLDHHSILGKNIKTKNGKTPFNVEEKEGNSVEFFQRL